MSAPDLVVRGQRVVTSGPPAPAAVHIHKGMITAVARFDEVPAGCLVFETGNAVVMPGLVDTHVHVNEPGRTEWEGFASATRAAAAGGVTTLVDMPLNSLPATTSVAALAAKRAAAAPQLYVDVAFWGGVVPGNARELRPLVEAGVCGFKCFLVPSGVEEFQPVTEPELRAVLRELAPAGAVLLVHAELPGPIEKAAASGGTAAPTRYSTWLASRPRVAENEAVALLVRLCREFGARVHIVHLSSADALAALGRAREEGLAITAETCPHYLTLAAEEVPDGGTEFKCAPPIRERENRERLWAGLGAGLIDLVASDHSPCPATLKCQGSGDFLRAWGGIASLELSLPVVWTQARERGYSVEHLTEWMCRGPARLAGLGRQKGAIATGYDADLVVWNPEASFPVEPEGLHHRHKLTPYAARVLHGVVETTFLRGKKVYERGAFPAGAAGMTLKRGES